MPELSWMQVCELLGTQNIAGSEKERAMLRIRIQELVELNGEPWVRENRKKLLDEWEFIVGQKIIP
jgi:hypothetical protein